MTTKTPSHVALEHSTTSAGTALEPVFSIVARKVKALNEFSP